LRNFATTARMLIAAFTALLLFPLLTNSSMSYAEEVNKNMLWVIPVLILVMLKAYIIHHFAPRLHNSPHAFYYAFILNQVIFLFVDVLVLQESGGAFIQHFCMFNLFMLSFMYIEAARRNSLDTPDNLRPQRNLRTSRAASALPCLLAALGVMVVGGALRTKQWSHPTGKSISVSLLQGNVPQQMKFDPGPAALAREQYLEMIEANPADLVLLPETAWTTRWEATEPALQRRLHRFLTSTHSTVALGLPRFVQVHEKNTQGAHASRFTGAPTDTHDSEASGAVSDTPPPPPVWQVSNSVEVFTADTLPDPLTADTQHTPVRYHYDKRHLVPFGEFIPEGFHWFMTLMSIPLGDQARGPAQQPLLPISSQRIGFNICYEDIFGEELLSQVKGTRNGKGTYTGGATVLANLTNLGWFGNSHALPQHLQIARMRALETARPIIRATNTGMTAVISARGIVQIRLRPHETGTLKATLQGHTGLTPYVRLGGNAPVLGLSLALLAIGTLPSRLRWPGAAARRKRRHRRP